MGAQPFLLAMATAVLTNANADYRPSPDCGCSLELAVRCPTSVSDPLAGDEMKACSSGEGNDKSISAEALTRVCQRGFSLLPLSLCH